MVGKGSEVGEQVEEKAEEKVAGKEEERVGEKVGVVMGVAVDTDCRFSGSLPCNAQAQLSTITPKCLHSSNAFAFRLPCSICLTADSNDSANATTVLMPCICNQA